MKNVSGFSRWGLDVATVNRIFPRTSRVVRNVENSIRRESRATSRLDSFAFRHTVIP